MGLYVHRRGISAQAMQKLTISHLGYKSVMSWVGGEGVKLSRGVSYPHTFLMEEVKTNEKLDPIQTTYNVLIETEINK